MTDRTMDDASNGMRLTFEEVNALIDELPHLLSGDTQEFELHPTDGRAFALGRFRMRTMAGQALFYMMFTDTKRGQVVDADYLVNMLADLRAAGVPEASATGG